MNAKLEEISNNIDDYNEALTACISGFEDIYTYTDIYFYGCKLNENLDDTKQWRETLEKFPADDPEVIALKESLNVLERRLTEERDKILIKTRELEPKK